MALIKLNKLALPTGSILQIKETTGTTTHNTTSTTFADVISLAITPVSSSSIIHVQFTARVYMPSLATEHRIKFLRGSTNLEVYQGAWHTGSGTTARREIWEYYDTHSSSSEITYKVQHKTGTSGNSVSINPNNETDGIYMLTLKEIVA